MKLTYDHRAVSDNYSKTVINLENVFPWPEKYLKNKLSLLDVGCGQGKTLSYIKNRYPNMNLIGIEPSKEMISKSIFSEDIICSTAEDMLFKENNFDLIISRFSFKWLVGKREVLNKINKYLTDEGLFLLWDSGEYEMIELVEQILNAFKAKNYNVSELEKYFKKYRISVNNVESLIKESGFLIEDFGEVYVSEQFDSIDTFIDKWLVGFGVHAELSILLSLDEHTISQIILSYFKSKFSSPLLVNHHNYFFICKRLIQ
jgi:ubiquinone/menaquinone biosynthesis C-methylase UbiE